MECKRPRLRSSPFKKCADWQKVCADALPMSAEALPMM